MVAVLRSLEPPNSAPANVHHSLSGPPLYESPTPESHFLLSFVLFKYHRKRAQIGSLIDNTILFLFVYTSLTTKQFSLPLG
jgi:hypothetical protein